MPSIATHYIFSEEIKNKLNPCIQSTFISSKDIYNIFAQSHDFFYYTKYKKIGKLGHHHQTKSYIINIIKEIKSQKLENNPQAIAFLYGTITHYVLDTTCHPFIFYKTGIYNKNKKDTFKYHGLHNIMERTIDRIYYENYFHKPYYQCNTSQEFLKRPEFPKELKMLINNVFIKTYNINNAFTKFKYSYNTCKIVHKFLINDRFGFKYKLYKSIDKLFHNHFGLLESYSNHLPINEIYINKERKEWNHPSNLLEKYTYSFADLYNQGIAKCLTIINQCHEVIYNHQDLSTLDEYIKDLDYSTGLECTKNKPMKFFEK